MIDIIESACFSSARSQDRDNQDAVLEPKKVAGGILFAVADGVGSYKGADIASLLAVEYLNRLENSESILNFSQVFEEILHDVSSLSQYDREYEMASTTLTYAFINDSGLYLGHIGDCRAYIKKLSSA